MKREDDSSRRDGKHQGGARRTEGETRPIILLDDGGVITDPDRRTAAWQRLAGRVLASLLGGSAKAWGEAHREVTTRLFALDQARKLAALDYVSFYRTYKVDWIAGIHRLMGLPAPSEAACLVLANRATAAITTRMRAALPGAARAIRTLHCAGYTLHTASGAASEQLAGCLEGMGVRSCFGRLYGADLLNTFKEGPEYYVRLFADVGILPGEALIVDDSPDAIAWAAQTGARTIMVGLFADGATGPTAHGDLGLGIRRLAELPTLLGRRL